MASSNKKASEIVSMLNLLPHQEGGYYSETFRDSSITLSRSQLPSQYKVDRPVSSSIYFLLSSGSVSHLHRLPCAETWHFYFGEPLTVFELSEDGQIKFTVIGTDLDAGQCPQYTVPPYVWFGSFPTKDIDAYLPDGTSLVKAPKRDAETHYSLVGCTCAPAFEYADFELASYSKILASAPHAEPFIRYLALPD